MKRDSIYNVQYEVVADRKEFNFADRLNVLASDCEDAIAKLHKHCKIGTTDSFYGDDGKEIAFTLTRLVVKSVERLASADI